MRFPVSRLRMPGVFFGLIGLAFACQVSQVQSGERGCAKCVGQATSRGPDCRDLGYQLVERTIQVPTMVTERRVVNVTECRTETRERTVTVQKMIPETKLVRDVYTVMVPHTEERVERYQVCVPVWREVVQNVTVQVPSQELRKETRRVCREVQVQELRTVTRDDGHWDEVLVDAALAPSAYCGTAAGWGRGRRWLQAYGGCGNCGLCRGASCADFDAGCIPAVTQQVQRVWKPNLFTEQVPVLVWRNEVVEEPYEYNVTVYHREARTQSVRVCEQVLQEKQREVQVTVCVPQKREAVRNISTYRTVAEPQVQRYLVQVPRTVQKEIDVQVCRLVPKTVVCRVPLTGPSVCND